MSVKDVEVFARPLVAGVDWGKDRHAVRVVDADGRSVDRAEISHTRAGMAGLVELLERHQVQAVGIERADGPVVDALLDAGVTVYVVAPAQVKGLRGRYGAAGNKDDHYDAYLLADTVRTDRHRLTPLAPDTQPTVALRTLVRTRRDLVAHRVAVANQLRAHLDIALPGVVGMFHDIDSPISRAFVTAFPTQDDVDRLTLDGLAGWLKAVHYNNRTQPGVMFARLTGATRGPTGTHGQALAGITVAYLAVIATLMQQITTLERQITKALASHPDRTIFTDLPRAGVLRAARLLAEIGDARGRFPTANSLAGLAGVVPSTRRSGHATIIAFRWAINAQLRDALCDFAADTRHANAWAADLYQKARDRGHRHPHAVRILARAWTAVIWKCWTTHTAYDPARHGALQRLLEGQQKPA